MSQSIRCSRRTIFSNIQQQRKDELTQQSQRERKLMKMFEENRIVK